METTNHAIRKLVSLIPESIKARLMVIAKRIKRGLNR